MSEKAQVDKLVVNTTTIAKMFGMTDRRVRQLVEEGVVDRVGHGRFDLVDTVNRYINFLKLSADAFSEDDIKESYDYEKWLHEKAKREMAEIELAHKKKEMHRSGEVETVMNNMVMAFRQKMLSLPTKVALMVVNQSDPKFVENIIEQDVHEALRELANYDPSLFVEEEDEEVEVVGDGEKTHD